MALPQLGYWHIRGLAEPIRMILHYARVNFQNVYYEAGPAPDFSREAWNSVRNTIGLDFPNLPYYIDGDFKLTESLAITQYVCQKYMPSLLGDTRENRANMITTLSVIREVKNDITMACYNPEFHNIIAGIIEKVRGKVTLLAQYLGNKRFLTGDNVTAADFNLYETLDMFDAISPGLVNEISPAFQAFRGHFEELEGMREYLARPRLVWNNTRAVFRQL